MARTKQPVHATASAHNAHRRNQHKPLRMFHSPIKRNLNLLFDIAEPKEEFHYWIKYYWTLGMNEKKIVDHVLDHFDRSKYGFR